MREIHVRADLWIDCEEDDDVADAVREYMACNDIATAFVEVEE